MPKISVLLPIYNTKEEYLRECVNSILNQTERDFELLILNDSPDNLALDDIVASFNDKRIRYIKNEKNMGITPSRNKLIHLAKGEYLAVMDHDDISLPSRFEKQAMYLDEHPEVGVVGTWADTFPKKGEYHFPSSDFEIKTLMTEYCSILHPSSMIRKAVLTNNHIEYEEKYSPSEDYALWYRLMGCTEFHNIPEVLFHYRKHDDNTSIHQSDRMNNATEELHVMFRTTYPALYDRCIYNKEKRQYVRLFKFLPLLMIVKQKAKMRVYLFNKILLFEVKEKQGLCQ